MKKQIIFTTISLVLLATGAKSQAPQIEVPVVSRLEAMKATNKALLEQQQKTLQVLDELKAASEQIKTLGKRG
ncbi:MAG: hypothetical protein QOD99_912 [Chthoniobacter sp.]|jgi:hypothetical protein|nr:hypothetical protein [Chthoniobacter sp.]